jgi:hypothetical protein
MGVKQLEHEADHSLSSSAEVEIAWSYTSSLTYVYMAWCLIKPMENFAFTKHNPVL